MERLDQVVVGAGAQAADLLLDLALGGEHDDRDVAGRALLGPDLRRDLVAVELGQHDVEEDQVGRLGAPQAESLGAVRRDDDLVALLLQRVLQQSLDVRVVVDDEDLGRHQSSTERRRIGHVRRVGQSGWLPRRADYRHRSGRSGARTRSAGDGPQGVEDEPAPRLEPVGDGRDVGSRRRTRRVSLSVSRIGDRPARRVGDVDRAEVDRADLGRVVVEQPDEPELRDEVGDELLAPLAAQPAEQAAVARVEVAADADRVAAVQPRIAAGRASAASGTSARRRAARGTG